MIGLSLLLTLGSFLISWCFEIITPQPQSILREEFVSVVFRVDPKDVKDIQLSVNGEVEKLRVDKGRRVYCKSVRIKPGENKILVKVTRTDERSEEKLVRVFMTSQVFPDGNIPPEGFRVNRFHIGKNESLCTECHKLKEGAGPESCRECHGKLVSREVAHPPAMIGCTLCHAGGKDSRYAWNDPIADTCFMCHGDKKEIWYSKKYMHGPPSTGKCYICHNPHSERRRFFLKKQIVDLCTTCHSEKREEKHPLVGFVYASAHPITGKPDPARQGRELSCTSCHEPHASNFRFFFQNDYSGEAILCLRCHKK